MHRRKQGHVSGLEHLAPSSLRTLAEQPLLATGGTVLIYLVGSRISRASGHHPILNLTLLAIVIVACCLDAIGIPYETYLRAADHIHFMLGPAVVLLSVPLFRQRATICGSAPLIALALTIGLPIGIISGAGIAWALGASPRVVLSLAPKSVTSGIALGISEQIGGVPGLTVVVVIMTGITGAVLGPIITRLAKIEDARIVGLAMGIASHGIGTARALQIGETAGAFSGLGMALNGVLTSVLLPVIIYFI
ncbi:LrgB family protein [Bradyrhizobium guangdongense]|uniref:LrgB family protein n=1 Tax=Bradyrhizobium guangdongense TaxID=1325090 RepID=A0ABX6UE81_9BRAD|nr:LrgB family protein [Bradyrhizobium guangdongense]QOZ59417.1 LrgB family protein [Bradyrhizobium guangdongense]